MKKILAVLLAALMLSSCLGMINAAALVEITGSCKCGGDHNPLGPCHCCIFCDKLDLSYLSDCARDSWGSEAKLVCCEKCTGIFGCSCGCDCCDVKDDDITSDDPEEILSDYEKIYIVDLFQSMIEKMSAFFDSLFETIFGFLGIKGTTN